MPAALEQSASLQIGGYPSASTSFSTTPTVGNAVIVTGVWSPSFGTPPTGVSVTDNQGNTYTVLFAANTSGDAGTFIAFAEIETASGTLTVTATVTGGSADAGVMLSAQEWSGLNLADLLDQSGSATLFFGTGTDQAVAASGANTGADRVVIAVLGQRNSNSISGVENSPPLSGFTNIYERRTVGFGEPGGLAAYKVVSEIETSSVDWGEVTGPPGTSSLQIATFAVAAGGAEEAQAETLTFSDSQVGSANFVGTSAESISFSDSQSAAANLDAAQAETLTLSDSQVASLGVDAAQDEALTLSDEQVAVGGSGALQDESIAFVDSSAASQTSANAQAESITLSDSSSAVAAFDGLQDESITLVDEQDATEPSESGQDETITFLDSQVAVQSGPGLVAESITFVDEVTTPAEAPAQGHGFVITDTAPRLWWQRKPKALDEEQAAERVEKVVRVVERIARAQVQADRPAPSKERKAEVRDAIAPLVEEMPGFDWMAVYRAILIELERRNQEEQARELAATEIARIRAIEQDDEDVLLLLMSV